MVDTKPTVCSAHDQTPKGVILKDMHKRHVVSAFIALAALHPLPLVVRTHLDVALLKKTLRTNGLYRLVVARRTTLVTGSRDGKLRFWSWDGKPDTRCHGRRP